ncbi:MAG TPA: transposase [Candidatus Dormibacteraeota bacterium]|nr:transposase [Candidatus Dormibacteraeota bacterium]
MIRFVCASPTGRQASRSHRGRCLRKRLRSTNLLERSLEEVKRRTKVIGRFPRRDELPESLLGGARPIHRQLSRTRSHRSGAPTSGGDARRSLGCDAGDTERIGSCAGRSRRLLGQIKAIAPATLAPSALRTNTTAVIPSPRVVSGSAYVRIEP